MSDNTLITTIDFLRHGQCQGGEIFRGTTDVELTDQGWDGMLRVIEAQKQEGLWEHVVSSPLLRCRLFSEQLHTEHAIPLSIEDEFRELNFGDWEGQEVSKIWQEDKKKVAALYGSPEGFQAPNGEHISDFALRLGRCSDKVIQTHKGKHLLFVQHGGTIRILLTHLLSLPLSTMARFNVPYSCFSRVQIHHDEEADTGYLVFHNLP